MLKKIFSFVVPVFLAVFILAFSFSEGEAASQENVHIKGIGSHAGMIFYFYLEEDFSEPCHNGVIYCTATNKNCVNYYPIIIAAKMLDKPLRRLVYDFNPNGDNHCYVSLLSVE